MTTTGAFTLTTTMRMINRVHGNTTGLRTFTEPAITACLTNLDILVISITNLADCCTTILVNEANLTRRKTQLSILSLLSSDHCIGSGTACQLTTFTNLQLNIVHTGTERD